MGGVFGLSLVLRFEGVSDVFTYRRWTLLFTFFVFPFFFLGLTVCYLLLEKGFCVTAVVLFVLCLKGNFWIFNYSSRKNSVYDYLTLIDTYISGWKDRGKVRCQEGISDLPRGLPYCKMIGPLEA